MSSPRTLLLFDPGAEPASWNERIFPGFILYFIEAMVLVHGPARENA
jgi:hypothetical protein